MTSAKTRWFVSHHDQVAYWLRYFTIDSTSTARKHLGAVREQALRRKRMIEPRLLVELFQCRADPLKRDTGLANRGQRIALGKTPNGIEVPL